MANEEHVAILKQGVEVWNAWRDNDGRGEYIDLSGENFSGINLRNANFFMADLRGATFSNADLIGSNFGHANVSGAHMEFAILNATRFVQSNLHGTTFFNAHMGSTLLENVDLSMASDLETIEHWGVSTLGLGTMRRSKGMIPKKFLRGIGWSESEIQTILPLYVDGTYGYYSCFISFSSKDEKFAKQLFDDLQKSGVQIFYSPEHLKIGDEYVKKINHEIEFRDKLILILSENSVNSDWVAFEVDRARIEEEKRNALKWRKEPKDSILFPITIDDAVFGSKEPWAFSIKKNRHLGDMKGWTNHDTYQKGLERLLRDLKGT